MTDKNPGQVSAYLAADVLAAMKRLAVKQDRSLSWLVAYACMQLAADQGELSSSAQQRQVRQVDLEDAIAAAVERGPIKQAQHRKNMAARSARVAERMSKHK